MRFPFPLSLAFLAAVPLSTEAQPAAAGADKSAFLRAVANAPALAAASLRTEAARERIGAAGRLADVEVEGMGSRMVGPMDDRATMWELNVRQPLPKRGERAADRERARAAVSLAEATHALLASDIAADVALALAEAEGAQARIALLQAQVARFEAVLRSVETRLGSGSGRIADRLIVQTRLAAMQLMIEEERRMAADALAEARGRLGLKPADPLPGFAAPEPADIRADDAAVLRLAAARTDEANAMAKLARASAGPMTSVGVRFEQERRTMGDGNALGLALMTDIPWRSRRYARAETKAAEAERAAAQADAIAAQYRISAALTRVDRAAQLAAAARKFSQDTLARLHAEHDAITRTASASGSESAVLHAVDIFEKTTEAELQVIRAEVAVRSARAELWRYAPAAQLTAFGTLSAP